MKIRKAKVTDTTDYTESGKFQALIGSLGVEVEVVYCTPYYLASFAGFIAVPEIGSTILVCQEDYSEVSKDGTWYYMSTVVDSTLLGESRDDKILGKGGVPDLETILKGNDTYKANQKPQQIRLESPNGHGILLSDAANKDYSNHKAEMHSSGGKVIQLNDSIDAIIIRNEHGDRIKISTENNGLSEARSIEIESKGAIRLISRESDIDLWCVDGKNINIENYSTKSKQDPNFPKETANINIRSRNGDINITSEAIDGDIAIKTTGEASLVNIESEGSLSIKSKIRMDLESTGPINVKGNPINLN